MVQALQQRPIKHPLYRHMSQAEATEALGPEEVGHVIIRPDRAPARLWLTIKLHQNEHEALTLHQRVEESGKVRPLLIAVSHRRSRASLRPLFRC